MKFRDYTAGNVFEPSVEDSTLSVLNGLGCGLYAKLHATRRCSGEDGRPVTIEDNKFTTSRRGINFPASPPPPAPPPRYTYFHNFSERWKGMEARYRYDTLTEVLNFELAF